jgi:hypothetical protein
MSSRKKRIALNLAVAGSRFAKSMTITLLVAVAPVMANADEVEAPEVRADEAEAPKASAEKAKTPKASAEQAKTPKVSGEQPVSEHGSLADVGAKLSDPTSNIWALFTEFDLSFSDGDRNTGDPKVGGNMLFQPILPVPVYGEGANQWKFLVRPTIPIIFSSPAPTGTGLNRFDHPGGFGDMVLPLPLTPPSGNWDWDPPSCSRPPPRML